MDKPTTASGYAPEMVDLVRKTLLHVATKLGDLMGGLVVVGGLVPSLLIDPENLPGDTPAHAGTTDLDLGLTLALIGEERYEAIADRLRRAGFQPDQTSEGHPTRQRWILPEPRVTLDFLIDDGRDNPANGGKLFNITKDWAAIIAPGLRLAFRDFKSIRIESETILGEHASREVRVCGPGAFVVLKALAFRNRGENKDAYDLFYLLRNFGSGVQDVAEALLPFRSEPIADLALRFLEEDFASPDSPGPRRVAGFLSNAPDEAVQADACGFVQELLRLVGSVKRISP